MLSAKKIEKTKRVLLAEKELRKELEFRSDKAESKLKIFAVVLIAMFTAALIIISVEHISILFFSSVLFVFISSLSFYIFNDKVKPYFINKKLKHKDLFLGLDSFQVNMNDMLKLDELRSSLSNEEIELVKRCHRHCGNWQFAVRAYLLEEIKYANHSFLEKEKYEIVNTIKNSITDEKHQLEILRMLDKKINERIPNQLIEIENKILNKTNNIIENF